VSVFLARRVFGFRNVSAPTALGADIIGERKQTAFLCVQTNGLKSTVPYTDNKNLLARCLKFIGYKIVHAYCIVLFYFCSNERMGVGSPSLFALFVISKVHFGRPEKYGV